MSEEVRRKVDVDGTVRYYNEEGEKHRLDGPAVEWSNGYKEWYIEGKCYKTEKEWEKARCPSLEEAIKMFNEVQHE